MPYLGPPPSQTFVSVSYQDLTGGSGTGFTLDYPVGSANEIEVFVNNVRQEPGVAYTVAGTTLTMTGSIVSTDDFYIVFQNKAVGTISHPAGNSLQATTGTFTGNVDINGNELILDADSDTSITADTDDQIDFKTGGSDRVTIDSSGNVGIGTTSPSATLEVDAATTNGLVQIGQLQFKNSSGNFTTGTDGVHVFPFSDGNVYHDNYDGGFSWRTGASNTQIFKVTSTGHTTIGNPSYGTGGNTTTLNVRYAGGGTQYGANFLPDADNAQAIGFFNASGTGIGSIYLSSSATTYYTSSDYRLKENDVDMTGAIERVKQLQPKRFNFIADTDDTTVDGFMAHEVQTIVPEAISGTHNEVDDDGNPVYQGIDQSKLVPLLTGALQEAIAKIEALEARVEELENA